MRAGALLLLAAVLGCAGPPGAFEPPLADEAEAIIWHEAYLQATKPPRVTWMTGDELDCAQGKGWLVRWRDDRDPNAVDGVVTACVGGLNRGPDTSQVAWSGEPLWETALAHELLHDLQSREGVWDPGHAGPDWQAGGRLERANALLRERLE